MARFGPSGFKMSENLSKYPFRQRGRQTFFEVLIGMLVRSVNFSREKRSKARNVIFVVFRHFNDFRLSIATELFHE